MVDRSRGWFRYAARDRWARRGESNPTCRLTATGGTYVLRRKPFGALLPSAHAIEREYKVMNRLGGHGFPVPATHALCEDVEVIGAPFYVMDFAEGRILWEGRLPDATPAERAATYTSMIETLAQLHAVRPEAVGLADYGPPGNYFERQVRRWTKQYRASQTDDVAAIERLIEWLSTNVPEQDRVSIIDGDYRLDNLIFARSSKRVVAVIDWELSTLGDPLADLAYLALNWVMPSSGGRACLGGLDLAALGIPDIDTMKALYCERTGRAGIPDLNWYFAFNLFRGAGIGQGVLKRKQQGNASSAQTHVTSAMVAAMADQAWEFPRRPGAPG